MEKNTNTAAEKTGDEMDFSRKLPIGVQSFEVMRNDKFMYVDKTEYVFRLAHSNRIYFLSRPRRFGKSLFLSTLKNYFLGKKELFKGLYIESAEEKRAISEGSEPWIEYPVLYLDFNTGNYRNEEELYIGINLNLCRWEDIYGRLEAEQSLATRFEGIIRRAYQKTGRQVVLLVDEYDKPLLQTIGQDQVLSDKYRNMLKAFYSVLKTCDQYIRFAFLTGVTKFSKVSIFSDLNNLQDLSLLKEYDTICGISQKELETYFAPEIKILSETENLKYEECLSLLKKRYDGYCFSANGNTVYNPFSILSVFSAKELKNFWFTTGTPTFLVDYLKDSYYNIPDLDGNIEMTETGLDAYRIETGAPIPILFQTGYLTIKEYIRSGGIYRLGFPNDEVRYAFLENLIPAYTSLGLDEAGVSVWRFAEDICKGNVESFMERLRAILAGVPYDNLPADKTFLREQNYQTAVYLIFKLMGQFVLTEIHCSRGRADCIVETKDKVYIFEFKLSAAGKANDALTQIREKGYAEPYAASGKKIKLIGCEFDEGRRTIGNWLMEEF